MDVNQRDAGLVRAVGPWGLAANVVSLVVGASIFVVPAQLAQNTGLYAPLAILACGLAVGCVAICFAEGGSRIASSGGAYGYIETAFGPLAAYVAGTLLWFSDALACGGISAALADIGAALASPPHAAVIHTLIIVCTTAFIAAVNIGGIQWGTRLVNAVASIKLVPLAVFLIAGAGAIHAVNFQGAAPPPPGGLGRAVILAVFAYTGMETALCSSGEVREPERTIPRALAIAMVSVILLYLGIQIVAQGILGAELAISSEPLADAMSRISPVLRWIILSGAALCMFGYLTADILGTPRMLFAFARDGLLPRALGRLHPQSHAPHVAILCYAALILALALSGSFAELAVLSAVAVAPVYMAGCAAAWRLARRGVRGAGQPLQFRGLGWAAAVGIASMVIMISLAAGSEIAGLFGLIGASVLAYAAARRWRRHPDHPVR